MTLDATISLMTPPSLHGIVARAELPNRSHPSPRGPGRSFLDAAGPSGGAPYCLHCPARLSGPCSALESAFDLARLEATHTTPRSYAPNSVIFEQGEIADRSYIVVEGWVALTQVLPDGRGFIRRFALPGDLLMTEQHTEAHACTATTAGAAVLCSMSHARRKRLEQESPAYLAREVAISEQEFNYAYEHFALIALSPAKARIARLVWSLGARVLGRAPAMGDVIKAPLSQIQIGMATCLTPVHVSRTLRLLREQGLVRVEGHRIEFQNVGRLRGLLSGCYEPFAHA